MSELVAVRYHKTFAYLMACFDLLPGEIDRLLNCARWSWTGHNAVLRPDATVREVVDWLKGEEPSSVHSRQSKYTGLIDQLDAWHVNGQWDRMRAVYRAWARCLKGQEIDLSLGAMSDAVLDFLQDCGVPKRNIMATVEEGRSGLRSALQPRVGHIRNHSMRKGRPAARLLLLGEVLDPSKATGATVSIGGLNWIFNVLGVVLDLKERS